MPKISAYPQISTLTGQELVLMDTAPALPGPTRTTVTATTNTLAAAIASGVGVFTATRSGVVPASGGGTATALRADGTFTNSFTGTWTFAGITATGTISGSTVASTGGVTAATSITVTGVAALSASGLIPTVDNTTPLGSSSFAFSNAFLGVNHAPVLDTVSGNIGYYRQTSAEIAAGVTPVNYTIPNHLVSGHAIVERYGTNVTPGSTDMTAAVQFAINVALQAKCSVMATTMCLLTASVNIDRQVDGLAFDNYFFIGAANGAGFQVNTGISMFSSTLTFSANPVSQLVYFNGVTFIGNSGASYVLNDGRFLRTCFDQCNFDKILGCNSSIYVQSIHFVNCNIRRGVGTFWTSVGQSYDFKFINCICEAWTGNLLNLAQPIGCAVIGSLLEGCTGTAIIYNGASGFTITGNYFEANLLDIDGTGATQANGVALIGNQFSHTAGNSNPATYSVVWGNNTPTNCVSIGNFHNAKMHNFPIAGMDVLLKDSASTSLFNNQPLPLWNSGNQNFFASANPTITLTDSVLGNTYGGAFRGYGIGGRGGQAGIGTLNAGTYTEGLTCDENAALRVNKRLYPPADSQAVQTNCSLFANTGAPSNANGANGDIYFNAAGGAGTTIYQKRAGAWVGIV